MAPPPPPLPPLISCSRRWHWELFILHQPKSHSSSCKCHRLLLAPSRHRHASTPANPAHLRLKAKLDAPDITGRHKQMKVYVKGSFVLFTVQLNQNWQTWVLIFFFRLTQRFITGFPEWILKLESIIIMLDYPHTHTFSFIKLEVIQTINPRARLIYR